MKVSNSKNIRFRNIHCYSNSKVSFDNTVYDQTHDALVRQREFAWLTVSGSAPAARAKAASPVLARDAKVEKLAGGFYNISGGAADPAGRLLLRGCALAAHLPVVGGHRARFRLCATIRSTRSTSRSTKPAT